MMFKILIFTLTLINPAKIEQARLDRIFQSYDAFSAKTLLGPLANSQVESLVEARQITEIDKIGRTFKMRAWSQGFNVDNVRLDEFYYISRFPLSEFYLLDIYFAFKVDRFTHYAVAVKYSDGRFYTVITLADFNGYH